MRRKSDDNGRHRYHEAGHAFAAFDKGAPFKSTSIEPDEETLARVRYHRSLSRSIGGIEWDGSLRMRERAETRIIMALAGPEGERMVDLEASRSRRRIGASQSIWHSFLVEARSRLRRNLPGYRFGPAISLPAWLGGPHALADALLERGTIPSREARRIVRDAIRRTVRGAC